MAADARTRGLQVLADLYPDPAVREQRQAEIGDAGVLALGNGVLRREDHSREMNDLATRRAEAEAATAEGRTLYEQNKAWFEQRKADLEELERLRKGLPAKQPDAGAHPAADPAKPDPNLITRADLEATERGAVAFFNDLNTLSMTHYQQFGEVLDANKLLFDKEVQTIGLRGVYAKLYKPQLDARAAKLEQEREEKIRADERQKVLASQASQHHPYPVRGNEPSTLDLVEAARTDPAKAGKTASVDDMVAEYGRLSAARVGNPV